MGWVPIASPKRCSVVCLQPREFQPSDWPTAERHFDYPGAKQAGYALTRPLYGGFLFAKGDFDGAIALATRAIEEDPLEVWPRMNLHAYLQSASRDREATRRR